MDKLVSVLMSVYKEPINWLEEAMESILNQTYRNIEFVIVLDNPDNKEADQLIEKYIRQDHRIIFLKNEKNIGLVESLNRGLEFCKGEYIARMDADDISDPSRIEKQLNDIQNRELDLVGCHSLKFIDQFYADMKTVYSDRACKMVLRECPCMVHPSWLGKKNVFTFLRGYRNIDACEDYDFVIRAVVSGFKIGNTREVLFYHRNNPNSISNVKEIKQLLLSQYLSYNYSKNIIVSIPDINDFLESRKYMNDKQMMEKEICYINREIAMPTMDIVKLFWWKISSGYLMKKMFRKLYIKYAILVDK